MPASFSQSANQTGLGLRASPQRILAITFPHLPTDRIARQKWGPSWRSIRRPEDHPIACCGRLNNAMRLTALDEAAERIGLRKNQGVAEARAICAGLDVIEAVSYTHLTLPTTPYV